MTYPAAGFSGANLAMILGAIDVNGLINAFLFGLAGAFAGLIFRWAEKCIVKWRQKLKERSL